MIAIILILILFLCLLLPIFIFDIHTSEKSKKSYIPCPLPPKFPFGSLPNLFTLSVNPAFILKNAYIFLKDNYQIVKFFIFTRPFFLIYDLDYIKHVLRNDFDHFSDRGFYYNEKNDPISANIFALEAVKWESMRVKLLLTFSSKELKVMFETVLQSALQMKDHLADLNHDEIEIVEMSKSHCINVVGSCAFGLDYNCFKNANSQFKMKGKEAVNFSTWRALKTLLAFCFPRISKRIGIHVFGKSLNDFFIDITRDVITHRIETGEQRNDVIQLLMRLYKQTDNGNEIPLDFEEITSQVFMFLAAGYETSSITLTYCLYELSINENVQEKLRKEILDVVNRNEQTLTYDAITEMKYMNQVIDETLRKYPPVPYLVRRCVKTYSFPDSKFTLHEDDIILVPILGLHYDPDFFPEPEKFDPERFSIENKAKVPKNVYMPFGKGPRICVGLRFALMQLKIAVAVLLMKYSFSLSAKTINPISTKAISFTLMPADKIYLKYSEL